MDFWSRLIGGAGTAAQIRQSAPNNPQHRLARFKKIYNQILTTLHKSSSLTSDAAARETIRICFQRLASVLDDEARSPAPHLCLSFAASGQIYLAVSRIGSAAARDEGVIKQAVAVFSALVDSEEEEFLTDQRFADALMAFIDKVTEVAAIGEDTGGEVAELLFNIAAKIRLQPEILPAWFCSRVPPGEQSRLQKVDFAGVTQREDFPLCYQLIDHVHHEGRIGDFSRTGLLYIFDSASKSSTLEQWIVESDLPTLMASGLGALYSQLSRKLSTLHPPNEQPLILALSDYKSPRTSHDSVSVFSRQLQTHMNTFLSHLAFWQDVLEHCGSVDVRQTLIDHFQVLFLQQLLYPSLLESSDVDGGSSVAVLTYLRHMVDVLDHPELVHMILHYLIAMPETHATKRPKALRSPSTARRQTSLMLLTAPEREEDRPNPALFNLVDLILNSVESSNPQTVVAALKLLTVILGKNHPYALGTLLQASPVHVERPLRTHGALNAELEAYLSLAENIGGADGLDEAYDSHLKDAQMLLETHTCSAHQLALAQPAVCGDQQTPDNKLTSIGRSVMSHQISPADQLSKLLLEALQRFLTNDVETNLALTETIITLASCVHLHLEGWLALDPSKYQFSDSDHGDVLNTKSEALRRVYRARRRPFWQADDAPSLLQALNALHQQITKLRDVVPDFDKLLARRKGELRAQAEHVDAGNAARPSVSSARPSLDTAQELSATPQASSVPATAVPKHLRPRTPSPSHPHSPRGGTPVGSFRHMPISPPRTAQPLMQRINVESPSQRDRARAASPPPPSAGPASGTGSAGSARLRSKKAGIAHAGAEELKRKIAFPLERRSGSSGAHDGEVAAQAAMDGAGPPAGPEGLERVGDAAATAQVSLSHVLTNVVVLQEFVLELAALLQVRATLFEEVQFA